jgi:hypothetical protein
MSSIIINKNIALDSIATGGQTITVDEPTTASFNDEVFVTGNLFQSHSSDHGATWTFFSPHVQPVAAAIPLTPGAFCCDQVGLHERIRNLWILVLQYSIGPAGTNVFRVAVSTSGTPGPPWTSFAFAPDPSLGTNNVEFDRPYVATTNNSLYISYNVFSAGAFAGANVFQIQLNALANLDLTNAVQVFRTNATQLGSLCLAQGGDNEMFLASHDGTGNTPLQLFRWPDAPGSSITSFQVTPSSWQGSFNPGTYSAPGPGGEWLRKLDARITGAWVVPQNNQVGFLWTALPGPGRPQPYIKAAVIDTNTGALLFEPDIFANDFAFAYPAACPNVNGTVGLSLFFGGGPFNPSHAVTWLDGQQWVTPFAQSRASTDAPVDQVWGDYCSCATLHPAATDWVAAGYTLQGGNANNFVQPQYVEFTQGP